MDFQSKVAQLQEKYYKENGKNRIFKSSQKNECAQLVSTNIDNSILFANAIFIIPETNKIYFDYIFFKSFANPSIFHEFINYTYNLIDICIKKYGAYSFHINWNSYTISSHERYKGLYKIFLDKYQNDNCNFHEHLTDMYVYYTPNVIQAISGLMKPLLHPDVLSKIILISKTDSEQHIKTLPSK